MPIMYRCTTVQLRQKSRLGSVTSQSKQKGYCMSVQQLTDEHGGCSRGCCCIKMCAPRPKNASLSSKPLEVLLVCLKTWRQGWRADGLLSSLLLLLATDPALIGHWSCTRLRDFAELRNCDLSCQLCKKFAKNIGLCGMAHFAWLFAKSCKNRSLNYNSHN